MKNFFRSLSARTPWLSLAVPLFLFLVLQALGYLSPGLFCMAVEPGGKEFICGEQYSHIGIVILQRLLVTVWVLLLVIGVFEVFRGRATRSAVIAWSVSALLFVSIAIVLVSLPVGDAP